MKIKNRFKKPLALLLSICMVLPLLGYASYIALAKDEPNPAESLISDGAMWLDEFLKGHPDAEIHGFDGISTYALGDGDDDVGVDPAWFNVYIMKMGADSESGPYHFVDVADDKNNCENFFTAFRSGTLSDMTLDYPTGGYTQDNWVKSGAMTWTKQGFVKDSAGFPQMTGRYNGYDFQYAIKSAYLGDSRIFNMGMVTVDGEERLWISLDRAGATAVVLPDTQTSERITLHYAPEEFPVTYSVTVDGKALEDMTEAEISAVWGADITTSEQAMTAVLGRNPTTSTKSQTAEVQITVPAGTYGSVYFDDNTTPTYPVGDYGNRRLGEEVGYTYKSNGTGDAKQEWTEPTARFSYSEPYSYGEPGKADDEVKVRVVIETRVKTGYQYNLNYFYSFDGRSNVYNSSPAFNTAASRIGDLNYNASDDTYSWTWTFHVGNNNRYNGILRLGINGQLVSIPHAVGQYEETVMSDGSIVKVELTNRTFRNNNNGAGEGYYTVTVSNARRDVIITEFITDELYIYGRLIVESVDGIHMEIKNRATTSSSGSSSIHDYRNWDTYAAGGIIRYQNDNSFEFNFVGNQIRVSLNQGYVWPGTTQDGIIPDTVNDVGDTIYEDTAGWETDVLIYPSVKKSLTLVKDDPSNPQVSYSGSRNQYGGPYDTNNNNAIWYYVTSLTADQLPVIDNVKGRQSFIHINAIQQTYEIKYLPGITVDNGNVTVTGGNMEYDSPNPVTGKRRADGFKWFVLDEDSMPFAGSNATDETLYTMQSGSNRALVSLTEPLDNSSVSSAQFQYWVLTDMEGYPVNENGERVDINDESTWVKYYPGEYIDLPDIEGYTKTKGAAGFQGDDVQRFTVYLTAYWGEPETPYINFVTANTEANVQGKYEEQFIGSWYNKTNGNPIYDGDTTPESDKIKVAIPVISFLDMDEVMSGGDGSQTGVTVTMTRNTLLNYMRSQGGDNLWYALDESIDPDTNKPKNHDYIWEDIDNLDELQVWFLYTLGSLKISSSIDGVKTGIEYKITFQLPKDNTLTAGNESQFFGTSSYKVATDQGDITLTKGENGEYVGYFTLEDKESIEFTKLPEGTWYLLELAENGHNGNNNHGYILKDGNKGEAYNFTASTVWDKHKNTCEADMTIDKILTEGVVSYGNMGKGIVAYDTHQIDLTVLGTYTVDLSQTSVHPDKDPTTDNEAVNTDDHQPNVQNFSYLTYTVTTKNLTSATQDLKVVLGIKSEDISTRVDQNGDLDGVRILNIEEIDGDNNFTIEQISSSDSEEVYKITLSDGTEIIYDCTGETHTMTWVDEGVKSGDSTQHTVKTSVPAVRGLTNYAGTASVDDSESSNSVVGKPIASNDVTARVYSYWLRVLAYVVDENYTFPAGAEEPVFKFKVTLDDTDTTNSLNDTIHYMLFNSSEDFGTGNAADGSPFEKTLIQTETDGEYYFEFELKHGQRIVIYDLDKDFTYKVEAINFKDYDYMQSKLTTNTTGSIGSNDESSISDGIDMVSFHFYPTQSLTVNSTIKAGNETATKKFSYDITLTLPEGLDWDSENPVPNITIGGTNYTLTKQADDGDRAVYKATVQLGNGESFNIKELPESTDYSIVASIDDGYSFLAKKDDNAVNTPNNTISGTLGSEGDVYDVIITKSAQLTIKANVNSSLSSDLSGTYKFNVTLKDADGKPVSGTFQMGSTTVTFTQGKATVSVPVSATGNGTASGSVTVTGLQADTTYTVTPPEYDYMTIDDDTAATGTLGAGAEVTVERTFTRKIGSLTIEKEVADYNKTDDRDSFRFTVTLTDDNGNFVDGTFYIGETAVTFNNGEAIVTVPVNDAGKGSVTITGIPAGVSYTIVENLDDADEYYPDWDGTDEGAVDADDEGGTTAKCFNEKTVTVEWSLPDNFWFRLSDVRYNATTHRYISNAISRLEDKTDEDYCITVTNKTNSNLSIAFKYVPDEAYTQLTGNFKIGTGDQGNNKAIVPGQGTTQTEFDLSLVGGTGVEVTEEVVNNEKFMSGKVILIIGEEGVEEP